MVQELFIIGDELRTVLDSLGRALRVRLAPAEIERVFRDTENRVEAKSYVFCESRGLRVTGDVDEYEPETIWIRVRGARRHEAVSQQVLSDGVEGGVARG